MPSSVRNAKALDEEITLLEEKQRLELEQNPLDKEKGKLDKRIRANIKRLALVDDRLHNKRRLKEPRKGTTVDDQEDDPDSLFVINDREYEENLERVNREIDSPEDV